MTSGTTIQTFPHVVLLASQVGPGEDDHHEPGGDQVAAGDGLEAMEDQALGGLVAAHDGEHEGYANATTTATTWTPSITSLKASARGMDRP